MVLIHSGVRTLGTKNTEDWMLDTWSVNCKWVLKNWCRHLGSASHPSQTNEAPPASKWDWSPFETWHRTLGSWILRKVPLYGNLAESTPTAILHQRHVEIRDLVEFSTSSIFTHSLWILAANSRLYYWMDVLLCHREQCLKLNFKLE